MLVLQQTLLFDAATGTTDVAGTGPPLAPAASITDLGLSNLPVHQLSASLTAILNDPTGNVKPAIESMAAGGITNGDKTLSTVPKGNKMD